jgi:hypothetical protein
MKWKKIGHIFSPNKSKSFIWMQTHASNPTPYKLEEGKYEIFFSSRDESNRSTICSLIFDINEMKVTKVNQEPVLTLGEIGAFDDSGLSIAQVLDFNGETYLYYLGWNLGKNVPFRNSIGVAKKNSQGKFERVSKGPIIDRSIYDPFSVSYPYILEDSNELIMWYGSHSQWGKTTDDMIHGLKTARSKDGVIWERNYEYCISPTEVDYAFSRPFVLKEDGLFKMFYSFRGEKYRIGYAESLDGLRWERKDNESGITVSKGDKWDSEMVCYPSIVEHKSQKYMFYNGNRYGLTGFGLAVLEN